VKIPEKIIDENKNPRIPYMENKVLTKDNDWESGAIN
jgi:hypothetical protein